ncbi:MAG TPA: serine hydrolase domain-containing protein, partial [Gemmatimonadaceae bacterium]|nr:serine hydrolase domain-containing protein [Gemmatimonadaceae bacterium]
MPHRCPFRPVPATLPARLASLALPGLLSVAPAAAQDPDVIGPETRYAAAAGVLTAFIEREMQDKGVPALSIALVDGNRIVWSRGFGVEKAGTTRPATANTVYRVGSVSKLFTDIGIMQLVERGVIDLDAPVTRYLESFAPANPFRTPITLRQLMSHHAGLVREPPRGHYFDDTAPTLAATVASLGSTTLVHAPGTTAKYSNAAIAAVGYLLERRSGEPFAKHLQRTVLAPLAMPNSSFEPSPELRSRTTDALMWAYHGRTFAAPTFALGMSPAGSMYGTMPDLGRFLMMLFDGGAAPGGRVLQRATLEAMWKPQFAPAGATRGSGIGFAVSALDGQRMIGHGGAIYGFATQLS